MASPELVRKVLMKLLSAKKENRNVLDAAREGTAEADLIPPGIAERNLTAARQQAKEVQDVDPLTEYQPPEIRDPARLPGAIHNNPHGPGQLRETPEQAATREAHEMSQVPERSALHRGGEEFGESDYFINEFERLTNRTPTPEELADPEGIRRVVEVLQQGDANIGRLDLDDVPF